MVIPCSRGRAPWATFSNVRPEHATTFMELPKEVVRYYLCRTCGFIRFVTRNEGAGRIFAGNFHLACVSLCSTFWACMSMCLYVDMKRIGIPTSVCFWSPLTATVAASSAFRRACACSEVIHQLCHASHCSYREGGLRPHRDISSQASCKNAQHLRVTRRGLSEFQTLRVT